MQMRMIFICDYRRGLNLDLVPGPCSVAQKTRSRARAGAINGQLLTT